MNPALPYHGRAENRRVAFQVTNAPEHVKVVTKDASAESTQAAEQGPQAGQVVLGPKSVNPPAATDAAAMTESSESSLTGHPQGWPAPHIPYEEPVIVPKRR